MFKTPDSKDREILTWYGAGLGQGAVLGFFIGLAVVGHFWLKSRK